jgi:hypothetical protein
VREEIRVRFGRDDKFVGKPQQRFFIHLGGPQAHDLSGRDDKSVEGDTSLIPPQNCHLDRSEAQWRDLRFVSQARFNAYVLRVKQKINTVVEIN